MKLLNASRQHWVSEAAYYKAEIRNFAQGHELEDWREAERDYLHALINAFTLRCQEDGGMSLAELKELASDLGMVSPDQYRSKRELIRSIQTFMENEPCYLTERQEACALTCQWRTECKKMTAVWRRLDDE